MFYLSISMQLTPGDLEWLLKYESINFFLEFIFWLTSLRNALGDTDWILIVFILILYFVIRKCLLVRKKPATYFSAFRIIFLKLYKQEASLMLFSDNELAGVLFFFKVKIRAPAYQCWRRQSTFCILTCVEIRNNELLKFFFV